MTIMGTPARQTALIGDQLFTDILGGNLVGMYTILVDPLSSQEFPTTKLVRRLERLVRARVIDRIHPR
jgi:predicted HAD superfamily phosphohydrolase YqeG